tara:strand:+ start:232 stop:6180 length:5949 start_codon:yes stop_codon:yes gene_type:complete
MPEIKHNFVDGKMNKDLDERLVPNGQYTDANNIQVSTSDEDAVGSVQNLLGNTALVGVDNQNITNLSTDSGVCVGAIADEKNNCAYWLVSSGGSGWNQNPSSVKTFKDVIYRTKHTTADAHEVIPVFIDFWLEQHPTPDSVNWTGNSTSGYTDVELTSATNLSTGMYIKFVNTTGEDEWRQITVSSNTVSFDSVRLATWSWLEFSWAVPSAYGDLDVASGQFKNRVLRFDSEKLITGINIVDDLLFWTDNNTEPKKINISNSIAGTEPTKLNKNTRLVVSERNIGLADDIFVKEEDVLVIKKGPKEAPIIIASEIARSDSQFFGQANFSGFGVGDTVTVIAVGNFLLNSIFRPSDVVLFGSGIIPTTENNHVRAMIIGVGSSAMTVEILSMSNTPSGNTGYDIYLEQSSTIFTEKFVRFATRWKYKNGEYSIISPFSTIAFRPGDFLYDQLQGFNSGMVNTVKEITIKDFIPYDIPGEVVQIDILYKESDSPIIYTVDNITKRDTDVSGINSWNTVNDSLFFNGEYKINSENIYSIIPSNQILRPWDAVPRKALAQSVVGNRVVYGNYLQNYDLKNDSGSVIKPEINIVVKDRKEVGAEMLKNNLATAFNATASNDLDGWAADDSWKPVPYETGVFLGGGFEPLVLNQGITKFDKISQNLTFKNNATYVVRFKIKNRTRGRLRLTLVTSSKFGRADVFGANSNGDHEFKITLGQANGGVQDDFFSSGATFSIQSTNNTGQGFNGQISNISCKKLEDNNKKSIKSQRNYQIGVVYADEFGRQTPVLTSKSASVKVKKFSADNENSLNVKLENEIPSFAHKFKYFVKENSSEYYNLAVDRIYSSSDGNAWVSFPSFERNKITEETYLVLKKQLDAGLVQSESAVYKVLGIENEAPLYIKQTRDELGTADGLGSSSGTLNGVFTDVSYRPVDDQKVLAIRKPRWVNDENCPPLDGLENLVLRFFDGGNIRTDWLEVSFIELKDVNGIDFYYLHLKNPITDQDSSWIMNNNSFNTGVTVTAATSVFVDRPEFAGKFFVKLRLDSNLSQFVLAQAVITQASFAITARSEAFYSSDDAIVGIGVGTATRYQKDSASGGSSGSNDVRLKVNDADPVAQGIGIIHGSIAHGGGTKYPWVGAAEGGYFWDTSGDSSFSTGRGVVKDVPSGGGALYFVMSEYAVHKWGRLLKFLKYSSFTFQTIPDNNETRTNFFIDNVGYCGTQPLGNEDPNNGTFQDPGHWNHFYNTSTFTTGNASFTRRQDLDRIDSTPGSLGNGQFETNLPERFGRGIFEATSNDNIVDSFFEAGKFYMELSYAKIWAADTQANVALVDIEDPNAYSTAWSVGSPNNDNHSAEQLFVSRLRTGSSFRFSGDATETVYKITKIKQERRYNHTPWPFAKGHLGNPAHEYPIAISANPGPNNLDFGSSTHVYPGTSDFAPHNAIFASNIKNDTAYFNNNIEMAVKDNGGELIIDWQNGTNPPITNENLTINGQYTIDEELTRFGLATNRRVTWIMEIENATAGAPTLDGPGFSGNYEPLNRTTSNSSTEMDENTRQFIEFLEPSLDEENQIISSNPAVFETQPKTDEGLDIYYEASDFISVGDHGMMHELPWFNCYSFGNGVESNRIKDDFNQVFVDKNAIVSTTLQGEYNEEHRKYGLIYSGLYNSISGVNDTSQFIAAEKITKDINPEYGSIQKLYARNSDLLTLCEDKSLRILANKDAVFNADGNTNLTATENVLGQTIPFAGNYGISQNPESFTSYNYRVYFADKQRGAILRLSMDGLTPISDYGMKSWFKDNLKDATKVLGSYDNDKKEYNVTISNASNYTVSFSESAKGWPSFKSFIPNQGLSVANNYYTFGIQDSTTNSKVWLHHKNTTHNNFYGAQYNSDVTLVLNDGADVIKTFKNLSYEGTQSKIPRNIDDTDNYYNIGSDIAGWEAQTIATDKQTGSINEFIEKEGKWFNFIKGDTTALSNLDTSEFTVQGLGKITAEDI